jgi:hypothetical protein
VTRVWNWSVFTLRKWLELGSDQCDKHGEGTWELIWVAVIMHAVKRLNGDLGFEIDCESVGVECHVGSLCRKIPQYSRPIHGM